MKDSNEFAYGFSHDGQADSWLTKTCILEMFLSFHESYGKSFSYRDFLMEVLLSYEKTYNCSALPESEAVYGDFQSDNYFRSPTEEEDDMIEEKEYQRQYEINKEECSALSDTKMGNYSPSMKESPEPVASSTLSFNCAASATPHNIHSNFSTIKTEAIASTPSSSASLTSTAQEALHSLDSSPCLIPVPSELSRPQRLRSFTCMLCGRSFCRKEHLLRHERIHTDSRPFACPICPRRFRRQDCQRKHIRSYHPDLLPGSSISSGVVTMASDTNAVTPYMTQYR